MSDVARHPRVSFVGAHSPESRSLLNGMHFLNEAAANFPSAISLAAGRPADVFSTSRCAPSLLARFVDEAPSPCGLTGDPWLTLGQYSRTGGIITELIKRYLEVDEGTDIEPDGIVITNGFQEALLLHLCALAADGGAVVALDPTYVGLAGAAEVAGVPLFVAEDRQDPVEGLKQGAQAARAHGYSDVALYVIPDFPNPGGRSLSLADRKRLLKIAEDMNLVILEDTAYRVFWYEERPAPTLLSLDPAGRVRQLATFSKSFLPGVRVGFSAQRSMGPGEAHRHVATKSFTSVATSPITQAIVGGFLLETGCRLQDWNAPRRAYYRRNRDLMQAALIEHLGGARGVTWTPPAGGFFFTLDLPFEMTSGEAEEIARTFAVLVVPMTMFSPSGGARRQVRLSFSNVAPEAIGDAVGRFAGYVQARLAAPGTAPDAEAGAWAVT